jgi:lipopolysaccharide/colanic/teichoic acid biosynthesis glycosyltransferase
MDSVKAELLKSLEQEKNILPEVIVCEARFECSAIRNFIQFLRHHAELNAIPFILDCSGLSEEKLSMYRQNTKPDEILALEDCDDQTLDKKIRFLRRVKKAHLQTAQQLETTLAPEEIRLVHFSKRAFDILFSLTILLALLPLMLLIAILIKLESKGPVFYISKRAGKGYKIFKFYKFRTMIQNADKKVTELAHLNQYGSDQGLVFFKVSNDPRITKVGSFLRNTSLDELPQLFNVLLGDMSLVGNRPLPLYEAVALTTDDYAARFMAPAGITGLWQIKKRGSKEMSVEERISIDIDYADNYNFLTDIRILANTPMALFQKENV